MTRAASWLPADSTSITRNAKITLSLSFPSAIFWPTASPWSVSVSSFPSWLLSPWRRGKRVGFRPESTFVSDLSWADEMERNRSIYFFKKTFFLLLILILFDRQEELLHHQVAQVTCTPMLMTNKLVLVDLFDVVTLYLCQSIGQVGEVLSQFVESVADLRHALADPRFRLDQTVRLAEAALVLAVADALKEAPPSLVVTQLGHHFDLLRGQVLDLDRQVTDGFVDIVDGLAE